MSNNQSEQIIHSLNVSVIINNIDDKVLLVCGDYYIHKDAIQGYRFYTEDNIEDAEITHYLDLILTNQTLKLELDREDTEDDEANRALGLERVEEAKKVLFDFLMKK